MIAPPKLYIVAVNELAGALLSVIVVITMKVYGSLDVAV
jgi:hypothetical protein